MYDDDAMIHGDKAKRGGIDSHGTMFSMIEVRRAGACGESASGGRSGAAVGIVMEATHYQAT